MTRLQELEAKFMAGDELTYAEKSEYEQLAQAKMDAKRRDRRQGGM